MIGSKSQPKSRRPAGAFLALALLAATPARAVVPVQVRLLSTVELPGEARSVRVYSNIAYVANGYQGLAAINVSTPSNPAVLGFADSPGYAYDVEIESNRAYCADAYAGLAVFDLPAGTTPVYNAAASLPNFTNNFQDVSVSGAFAYLADGFDGLAVIDLRGTPARVKGLGVDGFSRGVFATGNRAYLLDDFAGLVVASVSDPTNVSRRGAVSTSGLKASVQIVSNTAYVADWDAGLQIIDVTQSTNPVRIATFDTPGFARAVYVVSNVAWVADDFAGVQAIDVSVPAAPRQAAKDFDAVTGKGVRGRVGERAVALGNAAMMQEMDLDTGTAEERADALRAEGKTAMFVAVDGALAGIVAVADPIKDSTAQAIRELHAQGLRVIMATGDNERTAQAVAGKLGIDEVRAGILPEAKKDLIDQLRRDGHKIAMAGDGVNDAPALAAADVGIAMGTGADVAMESAGITLLGGDLMGIVRARKLARATLRNIKQNLFFAFAYNALGVPIAAGLLYPVTGLLLSPMIAAAAMSLSSVSVITNALRLRRVDL